MRQSKPDQTAKPLAPFRYGKSHIGRPGFRSNRLPLLVAALLLGCTPAQLATATKDFAAIEADADKLCAAVPTLVTVGDVANLLLPNLATTAALDVARAVQAKCVVIATAKNDLAAGGSLSSTAVTLLSDTQAIADLASDVAAVKGAVAGGS